MEQMCVSLGTGAWPLTPNDIRIGRCSLPHDWFIGFQVVWGLISVVARVRSGAVAKSAIVGVPSFRMVRL